MIFAILLGLSLTTNTFAVDEWAKGSPAGTDSPSDIDTLIQTNNNALDRWMAYGRFGCKLAFSTSAQITVGIGSVVCSNSTGTVRRTRSNTSSTTVTWADIDTGSEASSTTYYVFAVADATAETFTIKISASSSAPTGVTYYKKLGSFYNDASSNIVYVTDDMHIAGFGVWETKANDTAYLAATDGFVCAYDTGGGSGHGTIYGYSDSSNPPTTLRTYGASSVTGWVNPGITMPVRRGDYWKVSGAGVVYWISYN
jgi:hypothetical protein